MHDNLLLFLHHFLNYKMMARTTPSLTTLFLLSFLQTALSRLPRISALSFAISQQPFSFFTKKNFFHSAIKIHRHKAIRCVLSSSATDETTEFSSLTNSSLSSQIEEIPIPVLQNNDSNSTDTSSSSSCMELMIYLDPSDKSCTMWGLNMKRKKFDAYVNYTMQMRGGDVQVSFNKSFVNNYSITDNDDTRSWLRQVWKDSRLITEKTDILAVYRSDLLSSSERNCVDGVSSLGIRRGGFSDMIAVYTDRMISIINEEQREESSPFLMNWLKKEYGCKSTLRLQGSSLLKQPREDQLQELQAFLDFFRTKFPYYYDRCAHCGMSTKDQSMSPTDEEDNTHFVGYVYPTNEEILGNASRTEIYLCKHCHGFTRFPRYNSVHDIIRNGRGRCGEYAMLLYRILKSLGHNARWVVDWSDHVWVEILLPSGSSSGQDEWVHLDPCEAAVDKPLLYQEWGKNQTYIVAFHGSNSLDMFPAIEDVTSSYTTDKAGIMTRREEPAPFIRAAIRSQVERLERESI